MIERLLDAGADPNAALPGGETALMTAARTGSGRGGQAADCARGDVDARESARGQTALMWAAAHGNAAVIPLLLEAGADLSARSHGPVSTAEPGAKGLQFRDYSRQERLDDVHGAALRRAGGPLDAVRALLAGGADPNEAAPDGTTVLVVAAVNAHWELAVLLLDNGADPNASRQGWTPLHQVVRTRNLNIGQFPHPVPTGRLTSLDVARKLIEFGADVNARMTKELRDGYRGGRFSRIGATPILLAAKGADFEMMRLLAAAGADPNLTNRTRTTVLMAASGVGMFYVEEDSGTNEDALEAVKVALELGGDVAAADDNGNTALHGGAWRGSNPIVQLLIDRGAQLDARNKGGFTPLQVANGEETTNAGLQRRPETVALLRQLMMARGVGIQN